MATSALEALLTIQRALDKTHEETVPEGWLTSKQWAEAWNKSEPQARKILSDAVDKVAVMEMQRFRVRAGSAGVRPVPHYRMKS